MVGRREVRHGRREIGYLEVGRRATAKSSIKILVQFFGSLRIPVHFFGSLIRIPVHFFGSLRIPVHFFGSLRIPVHFCGSLRIPVHVFGSFRIPVHFFGSLLPFANNILSHPRHTDFYVVANTYTRHKYSFESPPFLRTTVSTYSYSSLLDQNILSHHPRHSTLRFYVSSLP